MYIKDTNAKKVINIKKVSKHKVTYQKKQLN